MIAFTARKWFKDIAEQFAILQDSILDRTVLRQVIPHWLKGQPASRDSVIFPHQGSFTMSRDPARIVLTVVGALVLATSAIIHYKTGGHVSLIFFYFTAVFLITYRLPSNKWCLMTGALAGVIWLSIEYLVPSRAADVAGLALYWNRLAVFLTLVGFAFVLGLLKRAIEREHLTARTDFLTGVANMRSFHEIIEGEMGRATRHGHALTIIYIDIDHFKEVNDTFGHSAGDRVLREVAHTLRANVRVEDTVARIGGDEFAVLLPETSYEMAQKVIGNVILALSTESGRRDWQVSFSLGAVTADTQEMVFGKDSTQEPVSTLSGAAQMIDLADSLMYSVKVNGRGNILHQSAILSHSNAGLRRSSEATNTS